MVVALWRSKPFFDRCEIGLAMLAAVTAAIMQLTPADRKQIPASVVGISAVAIGLSKWRSKKIEETEKLAKAGKELIDQETWSKTFKALEHEKEAQRQEACDEIAKIRSDYDSQLKNAIAIILEDFHDRYFRREADHEKYKHRTTLFTCVECNGESAREKRLAIYVRIGIHGDSRCTWPVDDNDPEKCRGVAGKIWFHGSGNTTSTDCEWPVASEDPVQMAAYARSLGITVDEARALKIKSRVFAGARIMARGQKWGVLLLDSAKEGHISDERTKKQLLSQCASLISEMVDRMKL
jgi:hypothetical protein